MRASVSRTLERVTDGLFATGHGHGLYGVFFAEAPTGARLKIVSNPRDLGWEHVSVSLEDRCPTWEEMAFVKDLFWGEAETVIQFHPARADYVNRHEFCLHLWKPIGLPIPLPGREPKPRSDSVARMLEASRRSMAAQEAGDTEGAAQAAREVERHLVEAVGACFRPDLTEEQLGHIRQTFADGLKDWRETHGIEPRKEDYELVCLLTAVVEQMHREGFNQMAEGPESEVK